MQEEIINEKRFRPIGFGKYWISEYGDIIDRAKNDAPRKPFIAWSGHLRIQLTLEPGVYKKFFVHRLVHQVFNEEELIDGMVIEHLDGNPKNNHYTNLKQSTQKENIRTAMNQGTFGHAHKEPIEVYDRKLGRYLYFDSVSDFCCFIGINCDSKTKLHKYKKFKERFDLVW